MQTTIRITNETRDVLERLKVIPQEPYERVIRRMFRALTDDEGSLTAAAVTMLRARLLERKDALNPDEMMQRVRETVDARSGKGVSKPRRVRASRRAS